MTEALASAAPTRRTQAERKDTMRRRLLDAAATVLRQTGLSGFRTADVIAQAGVSKGALLHHFATKDDLIVAVFEQLYGDISARARQPAKAADLAGVIDELIADSHAFFFSESFSVTLDITVAAARHVLLRDAIFDVVRKSRIQAEQMWIDRLRDFGIDRDHALDAVWIINSTIRGLAVRALWDSDPARFQRIEALSGRLIIDHLSRKD